VGAKSQTCATTDTNFGFAAHSKFEQKIEEDEPPKLRGLIEQDAHQGKLLPTEGTVKTNIQ